MSTLARHQQARTVGELLATQMQAVAQWLAPLTADEYHAPTHLRQWTIRHLVGHLLTIQHDLTRTLAHPSTQRPLPIAHFLRRRRARATHSHHQAVTVCGSDRDEVLREQLAGGVDDLRLGLAGLDSLVVDDHRDPVRTVDLLRLELAHWVIHSADLGVGLPQRGPVTTARAAEAESVRLFTDVVAKEHPGRAIELRVPPYAAVQLGVPGVGAGDRAAQGPAHSRGTPPNVVEMDARTLLRLAGGSTRWSDELTAGRISAGGAHADLAQVWPLLR